MSLDQLVEFIPFFLEEMKEERYLEAWKSNPFQDKSFDEWKEEVEAQAIEERKTPQEKEEEALTAYNNVISFFKKGGD